MNNKVSDFFDDKSVTEEAEKLWAGVFEATYKVLKTADLFPFEVIEVKSNPNIHLLIAAVDTLEFWLDKALNHLQQMNDVDHAMVRMVFNAKHQVNAMQEMATGLKTKDKDLYSCALERLRTQAAF